MNLDFALDLVQQRLMSPQDLLVVLESTADHLLPLGRLAIELDLLTVRQVDEIHTLQETSRRSFGAWARALGWLDEDQVRELLARQQLLRPGLPAELLKLQRFDADELRALARAYQHRHVVADAVSIAPRPPKFRQRSNRPARETAKLGASELGG